MNEEIQKSELEICICNLNFSLIINTMFKLNYQTKDELNKYRQKPFICLEETIIGVQKHYIYHTEGREEVRGSVLE